MTFVAKASGLPSGYTRDDFDPKTGISHDKKYRRISNHLPFIEHYVNFEQERKRQEEYDKAQLAEDIRRNGKCVVFQGLDRSGARLHLSPGDAHPALCALFISRRTYNGALRDWCGNKWSGSDVTWDRNIQSVDVPAGMVLELFVNEGFDPSANALYIKGLSSRTLHQFNNRIRSLRCLWDGNIDERGAMDAFNNPFYVE